jgi:curli biogenesis system outer membrane secretion channel CsgG
MPRSKTLVLIVSSAAFFLGSAVAQEMGGPTRLVKVQYKNGPVTIGEFLTENDTNVSWLDLVSGLEEKAARTELISFEKNITPEAAVARVGFPTYLGWQVKRALGISKTPGKVLSWDPPIAKVSLGRDDRVKRDQELIVIRVGDDVVDPDTSEVLGKDFREITRLGVVDIGPGFCTARPHSGGGEPPRVGDLVRTSGPRRKVAVLPPRFSEPLRPEVQARLTAWGESVRTRWTGILKQHGIPVVERASMGEVRKEAARKGSDQELGRRLGADAVIVGTLLPSQTQAQLRLVDVESGRVLFSVTEDLELTKMATLRKQAAIQKIQSKLKRTRP